MWEVCVALRGEEVIELNLSAFAHLDRDEDTNLMATHRPSKI